jgi:hypothetical protein
MAWHSSCWMGEEYPKNLSKISLMKAKWSVLRDFELTNSVKHTTSTNGHSPSSQSILQHVSHGIFFAEKTYMYQLLLVSRIVERNLLSVRALEPLTFVSRYVLHHPIAKDTPEALEKFISWVLWREYAALPPSPPSSRAQLN